MIYDAHYRMTDTREDGEEEMVVTLQPTLGGLLYFTDPAGISKKLEWDDEDPDSFIDDEDNGRLIITTSRGSVLFTKTEIELP